MSWVNLIEGKRLVDFQTHFVSNLDKQWRGAEFTKFLEANPSIKDIKNIRSKVQDKFLSDKWPDFVNQVTGASLQPILPYTQLIVAAGYSTLTIGTSDLIRLVVDQNESK